MENIFVFIFSLFREYVCLMEEREGRKTELPFGILFYENVYVLYCFDLFLFKDFDKLLLKVVLTFFIFIK